MNPRLVKCDVDLVNVVELNECVETPSDRRANMERNISFDVFDCLTILNIL